MKTIGAKIDLLHTLREEKRELEKDVKSVADKIASMEIDLIAQMDKEGVTKSTGKFASVGISENSRPSVESWDDFYKYIKKHDAFHLLERRPSVAGCNELFEMKGKIPGVVPYIQRRLNMRSI